MGDSSDSVSIDIDIIPFGGKECVVNTSKGSVSVLVCGDQRKPALITYPDVALNYAYVLINKKHFQQSPVSKASSFALMLLHNFCIYHIDAPGSKLGADVISSDVPLLNVDDLVDQVVEMLDFFGLKEVMCLDVTTGAYILTLFADTPTKTCLPKGGTHGCPDCSDFLKGLKVLDSSVENFASGAWQALGGALKGGTNLVQKLENSAVNLAGSIQQGGLQTTARSDAPSLLETGNAFTSKGMRVLELVRRLFFHRLCVVEIEFCYIHE